MNALQRFLHWLHGCYGKPNSDGNAYCVKCKTFIGEAVSP